jgi:hypothetical protein
MSLKHLVQRDLPPALSIRKLIGPSFIILGLGLGSGELILWPYLSSRYGMGIIWGAIVGITFQFYMNMEIERYALARGESIFVGFTRKVKWLPWWFLVSTFFPWIWPGIIASSAKFIGHVFGFQHTQFLAIVLLIVIGLILSFGPVLYKTVENLQKILISIGVPTIFLLSIVLARNADWTAASQGVFGIGEGYWLLPAGIPIASFLAALAYAGAGGNLNLAQSFYIKEKGYGMGKYAGRITSLLTGRSERISMTGSKFETTKTNIKIFNQWWKNINIEHFVIFWLTGAVTIVLLALLSYITTHGAHTGLKDIEFVFFEAAEIGRRTVPIIGTFFLLISALTLFGTQLTVLDATSRILTENIILTAPHYLDDRDIPSTYYFVLWLQIIAGVVIFLLGFTQPLQLLTIAAVLNAFAMFIHTGLTLWLNLTSLEKEIRPNVLRIIMMIAAFIFYGGFSIFVLADQFLF